MASRSAISRARTGERLRAGPRRWRRRPAGPRSQRDQDRAHRRQPARIRRIAHHAPSQQHAAALVALRDAAAPARAQSRRLPGPLRPGWRQAPAGPRSSVRTSRWSSRSGGASGSSAGTWSVERRRRGPGRTPRPESFRRDAHHRERLPGETTCCPTRFSIGAELLGPRLVRQHHHGIAAGDPAFVGQEPPAHRRLNVKNSKKLVLTACPNSPRADSLRCLATPAIRPRDAARPSKLRARSRRST